MSFILNTDGPFPKLHLSLVLPHGCNLKCPFCVLLKTKEVPHRNRHDLDSFMTPGRMRRFLSEAIEQGRLPGGVEIDSIGIHGDECLNGLAVDLTRIVIEAAADYGVHCNIVTNGTLFLRESSAFLVRAAPIEINVSLDSRDFLFCEWLRGPGAGAGLYTGTSLPDGDLAAIYPLSYFRDIGAILEERGLSLDDLVQYEELQTGTLPGVLYAAQRFKQHRLNVVTVLQPPDAKVFQTVRQNLVGGDWSTTVESIYAAYFDSVAELAPMLARVKEIHGNFGVWDINPVLDVGRSGEIGGLAPNPLLGEQLVTLHGAARSHGLGFCVGTEFGLPEELYRQHPALGEVPVNVMPKEYSILRVGPEWEACFNERTLTERPPGGDFVYDGSANAGEWIRDSYLRHLTMFPGLRYSIRPPATRRGQNLPSLRNG